MRTIDCHDERFSWNDVPGLRNCYLQPHPSIPSPLWRGEACPRSQHPLSEAERGPGGEVWASSTLIWCVGGRTNAYP